MSGQFPDEEGIETYEGTHYQDYESPDNSLMKKGLKLP